MPRKAVVLTATPAEELAWFKEKVKSCISIEGVGRDACHVWRLSCSNDAPVVRSIYGDRPLIRVQQYTLENVVGKRKPRADDKGTWVPFAKCGCDECVNPEHLRWERRAKVMAMAAQRTGYHLNPARNRKISESRQPFRKLSDADVAAARADPRPIRAVAKELGVNFSTVQQVRAGLIHKSYSSPWAGLLAR